MLRPCSVPTARMLGVFGLEGWPARPQPLIAYIVIV